MRFFFSLTLLLLGLKSSNSKKDSTSEPSAVPVSLSLAYSEYIKLFNKNKEYLSDQKRLERYAQSTALIVNHNQNSVVLNEELMGSEKSKKKKKKKKKEKKCSSDTCYNYLLSHNFMSDLFDDEILSMFIEMKHSADMLADFHVGIQRGNQRSTLDSSATHAVADVDGAANVDVHDIDVPTTVPIDDDDVHDIEPIEPIESIDDDDDDHGSDGGRIGNSNVESADDYDDVDDDGGDDDDDDYDDDDDDGDDDDDDDGDDDDDDNVDDDNDYDDYQLMMNTRAPEGEEMNWASTNNPVGIPLVSAVRNQGLCGACWAFVAASAAEASLRLSLVNMDATAQDKQKEGKRGKRRLLQGQTESDSKKDLNSDSEGIAYEMEGVKSSRSNNHGKKRQQKVTVGQPSDIPPLSVQELLDCDKEYDKGCQGGNPIYALSYIIKTGLSSWYDYEYSGSSGQCRVSESADKPIHTSKKYHVHSLTKVPTFNAVALLKALRKGPVSIGACGTDATFLFYSSGIYDSTDCCLLMNHAMLLVGYGTDPTTGLDYWLAQNSWGTRWGEKGFMRLLRQEGTSAGVCGIMMSPVVAAGGMIESTGEGGRRFGRLEGVLSELHEHYWEVFLLFASMLLCGAIIMISWGYCLQYNSPKEMGTREPEIAVTQPPRRVGGPAGSNSHPSTLYGAIQESDEGLEEI